MFKWRRSRKLSGVIGGLKEIPPIKLTHLKNLTDDTGLIQHAKYAISNRRSGYTVDDNSRALVAVVKYCKLFKVTDDMLRLANLYLSFIHHMQQDDGRTCNFMNYDRRVSNGDYSEDCMGRVLWACGCVLDSKMPKDVKLLAKEVFDKALPHAFRMKSLRGVAYSILGLYHYSKAFPEDKNLVKSLKTLADRLLNHYFRVKSPDWRWFEPYITYDNARMPHALSKAYHLTGDKKYLEVSMEAMRFLDYVETINGVFAPVGNNGWYFKGGFRAIYDQQPIEASSVVEAAASIYKLSGGKPYLDIAWKAFNWFLGENLNGIPVYNRVTGGCYDGLTQVGLNLNQGAESTVCYLIARLEVEELRSISRLSSVSFPV